MNWAPHFYHLLSVKAVGGVRWVTYITMVLSFAEIWKGLPSGC